MRLTLGIIVGLIVCAGTEGWAASGDMEAKRQAEIGLAPGVVLGKDNAELAEGILPPEILEHYKRGEYINAVGEWKDGDLKRGEAFEKATASNLGRFDLTPEGTIIDKATGQQPPAIHGYPFPQIDRADPRAAVKIIWNYYYQFWSNGNRRNITRLDWLNRSAAERKTIMDVYFQQYDGVSEEDRRKSNPNNLLQQFLATALEPNDMYGTTALSWRYRDPGKRDSNWAYVPALRRVRQVSPSNRSDGFLGSDMSQDDGPYFDGKPEDFEWKLVGEQDILRLADPNSLSGDTRFITLPNGGWRVPFKPIPMAGYQDPNWKGVAWAPVNWVLVRRPVWVIEAVPKDKYYLYGKIQLMIDRESFWGTWSRKFDWQGELVMSYQIGGYLNGTPDNGKHYIWRHAMYYQIAENLKAGRATYAGVPPANYGEPVNDFFINYDPNFFDYQTLYRFGK